MATSDRSELQPGIPVLPATADTTAIALPLIEEQRVKQTSLLKDALYRLFRNKLAVLGLAFILLVLFCAVFANFISPYGFAEKVPGDFYRTRPNYWFVFGTDNVGRDVFTRIVYGARTSMIVGFGSVALQLVIGIFIGAVAGYFAGNTDTGLMRVTDLFNTLPPLLIAIILLAAFGPSIFNIVFAISITSWVTIARLTRGQLLSLRELDYIKAARTAGAGGTYIIMRHLLPNTLTPLIVSTTFAIPTAIFAEAFLSFIGIGIRPPNPSWGDMVADGQQFLRSDPHLAIIPIVCVMLTMLAFVMLGYGLRDALDPKGNN
ncbi:MAG: ABC transporter permease [Chloroflexota bacterium]|nr:ABC transporter permease [Chloroflexota bacterium]